MNRRNTLITSKKLSPERIEAIKNFPITYDKGSPKLTADQIARMKPAHPEYWKVEPVKVSLSIKAGYYDTISKFHVVA